METRLIFSHRRHLSTSDVVTRVLTIHITSELKVEGECGNRSVGVRQVLDIVTYTTGTLCRTRKLSYESFGPDPRTSLGRRSFRSFQYDSGPCRVIHLFVVIFHLTRHRQTQASFLRLPLPVWTDPKTRPRPRYLSLYFKCYFWFPSSGDLLSSGPDYKPNVVTPVLTPN